MNARVLCCAREVSPAPRVIVDLSSAGPQPFRARPTEARLHEIGACIPLSFLVDLEDHRQQGALCDAHARPIVLVPWGFMPREVRGS